MNEQREAYVPDVNELLHALALLNRFEAEYRKRTQDPTFTLEVADVSDILWRTRDDMMHDLAAAIEDGILHTFAHLTDTAETFLREQMGLDEETAKKRLNLLVGNGTHHAHLNYRFLKGVALGAMRDELAEKAPGLLAPMDDSGRVLDRKSRAIDPEDLAVLAGLDYIAAETGLRVRFGTGDFFCGAGARVTEAADEVSLYSDGVTKGVFKATDLDTADVLISRFARAGASMASQASRGTVNIGANAGARANAPKAKSATIRGARVA